MTSQEQIEYIATKVMKWHLKTYAAGAYGHWLNAKNEKIHGVGLWDPLESWDDWRQVELKIMEDRDLWYEYVSRIGSGLNMMQNELPTRVFFLIASHKKLYGK